MSTTDNGISESILNTSSQSCKNPIVDESLLVKTSGTINDTATKSGSENSFSAALFKVLTSSYSWGSIQKSTSPRIRGSINEVETPILIDSGAEVNVLDGHIAKTANICIVATNETARAANSLPLKIQGQTKTEVIVKCPTEEGHKMLNLGIMLVVNQLGASCLIGQPGIEMNNMISLPQKKL